MEGRRRRPADPAARRGQRQRGAVRRRPRARERSRSARRRPTRPPARSSSCRPRSSAPRSPRRTGRSSSSSAARSARRSTAAAGTRSPWRDTYRQAGRLDEAEGDHGAADRATGPTTGRSPYNAGCLEALAGERRRGASSTCAARRSSTPREMPRSTSARTATSTRIRDDPRFQELLAMNLAHIDELDAIELPDGFVWRPVRRHFGIHAFGINAYTPGASGQVVEEHTEEQLGHEEIYLVLRGRVRFTVDGDEHELGLGQLVFVRDPSLGAARVALTDDAAVLAVGGKPGEAHESRRGSTSSPRRRTCRPAATTRQAADPRGARGEARTIRRCSTTSPASRRAPASTTRRSSTCTRRDERRASDSARRRRRTRTSPRSATTRASRASRRPGSRMPAASSRSAGTGSASGRATSRTAPWPASRTSESTSSCRPSASANALCACSPPNGTSSSSCARPATTSPQVTAPIETSTTTGSPPQLGIPIASGFVPASFGPPSG